MVLTVRFPTRARDPVTPAASTQRTKSHPDARTAPMPRRARVSKAQPPLSQVKGLACPSTRDRRSATTTAAVIATPVSSHPTPGRSTGSTRAAATPANPAAGRTAGGSGTTADFGGGSGRIRMGGAARATPPPGDGPPAGTPPGEPDPPATPSAKPGPPATPPAKPTSP